ncbi:hypothetical protein FRC02_002641 [Tulasnella sp. 418]|nr:hypothetical protein FRC02_002641 [Tulasnella sp. 418]
MEFPIKALRKTPPRLQLNFVDLPTELIIKILTELGWADILRCCVVSKSLYEIIAGSVELRYLIELRISGYVDAQDSASIQGLVASPALETVALTPLSLRLQKLLKQESAWRGFKFTSPIPPSSSQKLRTYEPNISYQVTNTSGIYELYGGVFVQGTRKVVNGHDRGAERLQMIQFGDEEVDVISDDQGKRRYGKVWKHDWLGIPIARDIGIDPGSDLLVLVESRPTRTLDEPDPPFSIYLKTMSTCADHPEATKPILMHRVTNGWRTSYSFCMVVIGDLLAIMFCSHKSVIGSEGASELVIWNWKKGNVHALLTCNDYLARSVSFISPSAFVIPRFTPGQAEDSDEEAEDIDDPQPRTSRRVEASLNLYSIPCSRDHEDNQPVTPVLIARYEFPEFRSSVGTCTITSRSDPAPCSQYYPTAGDLAKQSYPLSHRLAGSAATREPHTSAQYRQKQFFPDPEKRLIVLSVYLRLERRRAFNLGPRLDMENVNHTVFVHSDAFMEELSKAPEKMLYNDGGERAENVPWKKWSRFVRWTDNEPQSRFVVFTYGLRYAEVIRREDGKDVLRIWDFNSNNVGRPISSPIIPVLGTDSKQFPSSHIVSPTISPTKRLLNRLSFSGSTTSKPRTTRSGSKQEIETTQEDETSIRFRVNDVQGESSVQDRTVFEGQGKVKSSLPYRTLTMQDALPFECEGVMIDDRRIVLVR